ncbi:GNAT family N-acetyltransferase [Spirillospora sp. NPDC052242]
MLRLNGEETLRFSDEIAGLYRDCYARPPWSESPEELAAYPGKLAASAGRPGFAAWIARDRGALAGVCYGWPTPPDLAGSDLYTTIIRAAGAERAAAITRNAFELAELFVHPGHRGRGLGEALLTLAVDGWDTAWLITHPGAPAARLYRRLGWRRSVTLPADFYPRLTMAVYQHRSSSSARRNRRTG